MQFPYRDDAAEIYRKAFPFKSYYPNRVYKNPFGRYVYVNTRGFLHALVPCRILEEGKVVGYEINNYMLAKNGSMKFVSRGGWFSTKNGCVEAILSFHG